MSDLSRLRAQVEALKSHGNEARALALLEAASEIAEADYDQLEHALLSTATQHRVVRVPVLVLGDPDRSVLCVLTVREGDARPEGLDDDALKAIEDALRDAWAQVQGVGEPPRCDVSLPLPARIGVAVKGASVYLGAYLAAVSHFSGVPLDGDVVATGHPTYAMGDDDRAAKAKLAARVTATLHAIDASEGAHGVARVHRAVFDTPTIHPDATRTRVFVATPDPRSREARALPACWSAHANKVVTVALDAPPVGEEEAHDLVPRTLEALRTGGGSVRDVVIAGRQVVAAILGARTRQGYEAVRYLEPDGRVSWWSGRLKGRAAVPLPRGAFPKPRLDVCDGVGAALRVALARSESAAGAGWGYFPLLREGGERMLPEDLPGIIAWLDELLRARGVSAIDVTVDGPSSVAWALGEHFANKVTLRFFQWDVHRKAYPAEPTAVLL